MRRTASLLAIAALALALALAPAGQLADAQTAEGTPTPTAATGTPAAALATPTLPPVTPTATPSEPTATPSPTRDTSLSGEVYPLGEEVEVDRGGTRIRVRPLRTVRTADGREAVAGRLVVGFYEGVDGASKARVHRAAAARGVADARPVAPAGPGAELVDVSGAASIAAAQAIYRDNPEVKFASPDYVNEVFETPNDPLYGSQWGLPKVSAPAAWDVTRGVASVSVAILDTGIANHTELGTKVILAQNFSTSDTSNDLQGHGTHVAGIAAAITNNATGIAGLGRDMVLINAKVMNDDGSGADSAVAQGIRWAADSGARVINMSLGGDGPCTETLSSAVQYAWTRGVVIVAAAGNSAASSAATPANCPNTIAVGSVNSDDAKSSFSNYGAATVDVAAPGGYDLTISGTLSSATHGILSTLNNGSYGRRIGTSMAAPFVAGLAGLVWSTGWGTSNQAVVDRVLQRSDTVAGTGGPLAVRPHQRAAGGGHRSIGHAHECSRRTGHGHYLPDLSDDPQRQLDRCGRRGAIRVRDRDK